MNVSAGSQPGAGSGAAAGGSAAPDLVLVNGRPLAGGAGVSVLDRGLHYGDGLFETIPCRHGRARFLSLHLERLAAGCERLRINLGDVASIRREIESAIAGTEAVLLKLIVTRGEGRARGYGFSGEESPLRLLFRYPWPAVGASTAVDGARVRVANVRLGENAALAGMKHLNRLEQVLARAEASSAEADELLLFSSSGRLACGTMSNVFLVRGGRLTTPRLDLCGVEGVMRRVVLREAARAGIPAEETSVAAADLENAAEVFVTNARIGIWPVCRIGDRSLSPGEITRRLQALIAPMLDNPVDA
jgi:4-amino-4-deoxychorismate lyase